MLYNVILVLIFWEKRDMIRTLKAAENVAFPKGKEV